jgi:hypothetical protein
MEQTERSAELKGFDTERREACSEGKISNLKKLVDQFKSGSANRVELDSWGNYHSDSFTRT